MSKLIKSFEDVSNASIATFNDGKTGESTLDNTDVYKKPHPVGGTIDVVERFCWFSSSMSNTTAAAIAKIPKLMLTEKEQVLNSQLSQALYYINSVAKAGTDVANSTVVSKFAEFIGVNDAAQSKALNKLNSIKASLQGKTADGGTVKRLESNFLRSLIGLYLTEDTGFTYCLPYFERPPSINNSWGASNNESVASGLINTGMDIVEEISSFVNLAQPGVYIQKAKHFSFAEEGPTLTVKFPLFNTVTRNQGDISYQLNYEFLWLLTYQNKPYKTSFARTLPPKIYDATIQGMVNMPYAYISSLEVDFVGTVRNKEVEIADIGRFSAPIPDAYEVTIQFTSLLSDYANLMVGSGFHGNTVGNTVTIGKTAPVNVSTPALDPQDPSAGITVATNTNNTPTAASGIAGVTTVAANNNTPLITSGSGGNIRGLGTGRFGSGSTPAAADVGGGNIQGLGNGQFGFGSN